MPANRCPNPNCEYFNRALPNNAKVCPWCSTPLDPANQIAPTPTQNKPIPPQPTPPQNIQPARPATTQPNYQPPNYQPSVDYSTDYQQRAPDLPPTWPVYTSPTPRLPVLKLIHTSGREFQWSGEAGFIGRRSQNTKVASPEIELAGIPHEGVVSRRHARVYWDWSQNAYMIIDMSINGIYLNGNPLSPGVPYRLLNGDLLQLGQENLVRFTVYVM